MALPLSGQDRGEESGAGSLSADDRTALACIVALTTDLELSADPRPLLFVGDQPVSPLPTSPEPCPLTARDYYTRFRRVEVVKPAAAQQVMGADARSGIVRVFPKTQ